MALKRKRSSPTLSSPFSSDNDSLQKSSSPLPFFYTQSKPTEALYQKPAWSFPTYESDEPSTHISRHLNSRTRKRHRDDRPDEESIHGVSCWLGAVVQMSTLADVCRCAASTISRLYEAQRQHPQAEPIPSQSALPATQSRAVGSQKNTLHSFWNIRAQPRPNDAMAIDPGPSLTSEMRCEDCDSSLQPQDAMELDEGTLDQETACNWCRKHVCDKCAVLGDERVCLCCATGR